MPRRESRADQQYGDGVFRAGANCVRKSSVLPPIEGVRTFWVFRIGSGGNAGKILRISGWRSSFATRPSAPLRETNPATFAPDVY